MYRRAFALFVLLLSLAAVSSVLADASGVGTVVEGVSVPGVALGDTRAEVEASVGPHESCSSVEAANDYASCKFAVTGGGNVWVRYRGPDGGEASNSPDDVVRSILWIGVYGWETTAGVDLSMAETDRQAVADAYSNAEVSYYSSGQIYSVRDPELGIQVVWNYNFYSGFTTIYFTIFNPYTPEPPPPSIRVEDIQMSYEHRTLTARVLVLDNEDQPAEGAQVDASWTTPEVTNQPVSAITEGDGYATFIVEKARRGSYYLYINDLSKDGYEYDYINSQTLGTYTKGRGN